jgi:hypothetical protein
MNIRSRFIMTDLLWLRYVATQPGGTAFVLARDYGLLPQHKALYLAARRLGQAIQKLDLAGIGMTREALPYMLL